MHLSLREPSLPPFHTARLLVIGDVMLDRYWLGNTSRVSPEAPVPIVNVQEREERLGGAANVACNIRQLGSDVTLLGVIGFDEAGEHLLAELKAMHIHADLYQSKHVSTVVKLRVLSKHQQLLRMDFEKPYLDDRIEAELLTRFKGALPSVQLVILSDYLKGTLRHPDVFIRAAKAANVPVLVDPKSTDVHRYNGATWLTPNLKEFENMVGQCLNEEEMVQKGQTLLRSHDLQHLLITRSEAGMSLIEQDNVVHLPAVSHEIYDVTGAGDTVISTLGAALASGASSLDAVRLSNIAAGIAVTKLGATAVSLQELTRACFGNCAHAFGRVDETQLLAIVKQLRASGKKMVFTNGCYDIIHAGHIASLQMAKALGDYLIVAVNSDESIKALKGQHRPINSLTHRCQVLAELRAVDWVIPFADSTPKRLLNLIKPEVLAKGGDYTLDQVVGADIVRSYGGEVHVLQHGITLSTTNLIRNMQSLKPEHQLLVTEDEH